MRGRRAGKAGGRGCGLIHTWDVPGTILGIGDVYTSCPHRVSNLVGEAHNLNKYII